MAEVLLTSFFSIQPLIWLVNTIERSSIICAETIVVVVTAYRTWGTFVNARRARLKASIASVLLRDGESIAVFSSHFL